MRQIENDSPAMMALRGEARTQLVAGVDAGKVAYDLARNARVEGVSDADLNLIVNDLRDEGWFPHTYTVELTDDRQRRYVEVVEASERQDAIDQARRQARQHYTGVGIPCFRLRRISCEESP